MRSALSLKPSNGNAAKSQAVNNKNVIKNAPLGGKLTRQIGTSNLLQQALPSKKIDESPIIKIDAKDSFKVFEDQEPEKENSSENVDATEKDSNVIPAEDNNMIHELERKMEEKSRAEKLKFKFMQTRDNSDITSRFSEPPSEFSVLCDDDDCDKVSVASSTFTTSVRATFSSFHFDENQRKKEFGKEEAVKKIQKKAAKEARDDSMFSSEEFFPDIIKYMLHRQTKNRASHECFDIQSQVNEEMRTILIDWFSDAVKEYNFQKETFHLAVILVDLALPMFNIDKMRFQLVGMTSMMITVKYDEIFPPVEYPTLF